MTRANQMNSTAKVLLWAAIIIAAALMASGLDVSASASFGLFIGALGNRIEHDTWGAV